MTKDVGSKTTQADTGIVEACHYTFVQTSAMQSEPLAVHFHCLCVGS